MDFEDDELLETEPEDDGVVKFRDEYDEDYLTIEHQVTGMVRIVVHSHDGYGVDTPRHVELHSDTALEFARAILDEVG